jgi:hypothetical protein
VDSPYISVKTLYYRGRIFDILLCLFPHIEYGAILARTQDVLSEVSRVLGTENDRRPGGESPGNADIASKGERTAPAKQR